MFIKNLTVSTSNEIIRNIPFRKGINLIIDESSKQITGNNVGKTTVLKLIDFCLGGSPRNIYLDPENKKQEYLLVKDFLIKNQVLITLILSEDLDVKNSREIKIERNFLSRSKIVRKINNESLSEEDFNLRLLNIFFPGHYAEKPTFRQIISHNIRYKDESLNNTLKTLDHYTTDAEYETLYLYLFGCDFSKGNLKQEILLKLKEEANFKSRLEKNQTKTAYEVALSLINNRIDELNKIKANFNLNENFESDLENFNKLKYQINLLSSEITKLEIRYSLIIEAEEDLKSTRTSIDLQQLELIYKQATSYTSNIQKTFNELVIYHNQMLDEKIRFIKKELPSLIILIEQKKSELKKRLNEEKELSSRISKSDSFEELENLIIELNENFRKKGEYENTINQLEEVEKNIKDYDTQLNTIEAELFSDDFESVVKTQLSKFNKFFSSISKILYNEEYAVKHDIIYNKYNQRLYKFSSFNANLSSGKKQGEITCFDIAFTLFADSEQIPCLHFLLNDKKELVHDNQLVKIANLVNEKNIQFVASILRDKLPKELDKEEFFIVKLSQNEKLFKIEKK
ncbi:MAG: DUF2326 domain-containing protein [Leptospiraceae bacterium]|jgi:uncharacterized protein YydD (DUF2326 family)|nr:DUF2326 domain-containing protein [Leptospiraceae bacterium]